MDLNFQRRATDFDDQDLAQVRVPEESTPQSWLTIRALRRTLIASSSPDASGYQLLACRKHLRTISWFYGNGPGTSHTSSDEAASLEACVG